MGLTHLAPTATQVPCSGVTHTLVWREGTLHVPDHPDPDADRALVALGGDPCRCVELLDAWQRHATDPRVLVLGPRGSELVTAEGAGPGGGAAAVSAVQFRAARSMASVSYGSFFPAAGGGRTVPGEPEQDLLPDLLSLGGGIPRRLVATVADALIARDPRASESRLLHAALYGRALVALGQWLGELPELALTLVPSGAAPSLTRAGSAVSARLCVDWLVDVWAASLETVLGRFVLAASRTPSDGWNLLTVDPLMTVNTCTLKLQ